MIKRSHIILIMMIFFFSTCIEVFPYGDNAHGHISSQALNLFETHNPASTQEFRVYAGDIGYYSVMTDYQNYTNLGCASPSTLPGTWVWCNEVGLVWRDHFWNPDDDTGLVGMTASKKADTYWKQAISEYTKGNKELAYQLLGAIAHLLADMSVPAHVLNDPHPPGNGDSYEYYMESHYTNWNSQNIGTQFSFPDNWGHNDLFYNLAQRAQFFPSDNNLGNRNNTAPDWFDDSWHNNSAEMRTCSIFDLNCHIDDNNCSIIGDKLMPLAIQYTAQLYKLFWNEVHGSSSTCPPPGYPDYTVDCGNGTCCPYSYPVCCSDGICYMYESDCNSDTGCPSDYPIDCLNGWCCPLDYPICGSGSETGQCFECPLEVALNNNQSKLDMLRKFRDEVLSQTPEGRELIKLYYLWSPAVVNTMNNDEEFKVWVKETIDELLPMIESEME